MQSTRMKYNVVSEALAGEIECGDQYLVKELNDSILIAVADGLGHGSEAAFAAKEAIKILDTHANEPLQKLVEMCHRHLEKTRGVALTIVRVTHNDTLTYLAIGNVTGVCWQFSESNKLSKQSLLLEGGVVGYRVPVLKLKNFPIKPGDIFILATDGLQENFEIEPPNFLKSTEFIATHLFRKYRNIKDDGLILVVQFL